MSVTAIDRWRTAGCGHRCRPRWHDPMAHESYGRLDAQRLMGADHVVRTGPLTIDTLGKSVRVNDTPVALSPHERDILVYLASRLGTAATHREIVWAVWGPAWVDGSASHLTRVNVARLRRRLGPAARWIATRTSYGYLLEQTAPERVSDDAPPWRLLRRPDQWSLRYDRCQCCHRHDLEHHGRGYCNTCAHPRHRTRACTRREVAP